MDFNKDFNRLFYITIFFNTIVVRTHFAENLQQQDQCFYQLTGSIGDRNSSVETVDHFNNVKIYPRLQSLLEKDYFRFYKVNLKRPCPFWSDNSKCATRYCHVKPCEDKDVPQGLKGKSPKRVHIYENPADKYKENFQDKNCGQADHSAELGYLNTTISMENYKDFEMWQKYDDAKDNFCIKETESGQYVDLLLNPERYTGYKGKSAHRIWRSIYKENCFRPDDSPKNFIETSKLKEMCLEKRAFYRVISGLHASINIHVSSKYLSTSQNGLVITENWGPNLEEFRKKFSPELTEGEGSFWLKNLYFIYLLELRALAKAAPYLEKEEYYTGNEVEDKDTRLAMKDVLNIISSFSDDFNEKVMFNGGIEAQTLKEEFVQHFRNISLIMDCLDCEKCKLWGNLQIHGLGTALTILFSEKFNQDEPTVNNMNKKQFYLERSEIVALLNAFGRLSESIFQLERFRKMMGTTYEQSLENIISIS